MDISTNSCQIVQKKICSCSTAARVLDPEEEEEEEEEEEDED